PRHELPHRRELLRRPGGLAGRGLPGQRVVVLLRAVQHEHEVHDLLLSDVLSPETSEPAGRSGHRPPSRAYRPVRTRVPTTVRVGITTTPPRDLTLAPCTSRQRPRSGARHSSSGAGSGWASTGGRTSRSRSLRA